MTTSSRRRYEVPRVPCHPPNGGANLRQSSRRSDGRKKTLASHRDRDRRQSPARRRRYPSTLRSRPSLTMTELGHRDRRPRAASPLCRHRSPLARGERPAGNPRHPCDWARGERGPRRPPLPRCLASLVPTALDIWFTPELREAHPTLEEQVREELLAHDGERMAAAMRAFTQLPPVEPRPWASRVRVGKWPCLAEP